MSLNATLLQWPGPFGLNARMRAEGFIVPEVYRSHVASLAPQVARAEAEIYWNEIAAEYVRSAGEAISEQRAFPAKEHYRSELLDKIFSCTSIDRAASARYTQLVDAIRKADLDIKICDNIAAEICVEKQREIGLLGLSGSNSLLHTNAEKRKLWKDAAESAGLVRIDGGAYALEGTVFDAVLVLDAGPAKSLSRMLALRAFLCQKGRTREGVFLSFERISPGFNYYWRFVDVAEARLGMCAHIQFARALLESLSWNTL